MEKIKRGCHSFPSSSSTKVDSNFQRLLDSLTPQVPLRQISENKYIQSVNNNGKNPCSGQQIHGHYMLTDLWDCFEEWSAYGRGTKVTLKTGETVQQYFTPFVSALHILTTNNSTAADHVLTNKSEGSKSTDNLLRSSSNSSSSSISKFCDSSSGESSADPMNYKKAFLQNPSDVQFQNQSLIQFHDVENPYRRLPFFDKIQKLAKQHPVLMTLRSSDLLPTSWMAVAWYPIYHIPHTRYVKDLLACFITFHKLSPSTQDAADADQERHRTGGSKAMLGCPRMHLRPFGLAALKLTGDVWFNCESDQKMYNDLYAAASSWIKQQGFYHHDFNFFSYRTNFHSSF